MMTALSLDLTSWLLLTDFAIRCGLSLRVIMRKRAPSVSFAWLAVILLIPFAGAVTYLLFGESRLGERRASRLLKDRPILREWSSALRGLLLDSIGSKSFLRSRSVARLRKAGIEVSEALPAGIIRALFIRIDLRNHRKIAVIDGKIAYTGSQNLVDPRFFKQTEQVGEWVDAMVRITGPVVELLAAVFLFDWLLERRQSPTRFKGTTGIQAVAATGEALVQLVPSGPGYGEDTIHDLLLTSIYAARRELILTTPYFVPDNAILAALRSAARRGVEVTIIVPEKNDSRLVHYASRARFDALIEAGVRIMAFHGGLLHTKTITVDNDFALFGSVNLDMRSFWLNFEMTLVIYDKAFTTAIRELQQQYLQLAHTIGTVDFGRRSYRQRLLENIALLLGPLL